MLALQAAEMIVVIVVACIPEVRVPAPDVAEALTTGHSMPLFVVVQAQRSTVALRHGWSVETLEAPAAVQNSQQHHCNPFHSQNFQEYRLGLHK